MSDNITPYELKVDDNWITAHVGRRSYEYYRPSKRYSASQSYYTAAGLYALDLVSVDPRFIEQVEAYLKQEGLAQ